MYEDRIKFIQHKGKRIFCNDYTGLSPEEAVEMLGEITKAEVKEPIGSILSCGNYTNMKFNLNVVNAFNKDTKENSKYYKATACVGIKGLIKVMYDAVSKFTKQDMKTFESESEALDWLATK